LLLQIEDEIASGPDELLRKVAIGIDLGTTHTVVSYFQNNKLMTCEIDGQKLIPSVVSRSQTEFIVGKNALNDDKAIHSVKRHMHDPSQVIAFDKNVVELSSIILKFAKDVAENALQEKITHAVITVPAYFDETQRQATHDAAKLAGLNVLRLLNEPTAAALSYDLDKGKEGLYLVYDLGGGTFDVSLLKLNKGVFQVIATGGDTALGGDDIDKALLDVLILADNPQNRLKVRQIKHDLTNISEKNGITQNKLEEISKPLIDKTLQICGRVLEDSGCKQDDILGILLVGGSTRLYRLEEIIHNHFQKKIFKDIDPDLCVSYGAALQANALTSRESGTLLLDVTPLSLGIETMGGMVEKIIHRNTAIPIKKAQDFTTYQDGQTALKIHILQGEREMVCDCRSLGEFELRNIPPMPAGLARIRVIFSLDADGLLNVSAKELHTGVEQVVDIKPSYGLTPVQMEKMLYDAYKFGQEDLKNRLLQESIIQAKHFVHIVKTALNEDGDLLEPLIKAEIFQNLAEINRGIEQQDRDTIEENKEKVTKATQSFAEQRLERSIAKKIVGQDMDAKIKGLFS
jgi:molecular chaperone HscA